LALERPADSRAQTSRERIRLSLAKTILQIPAPEQL
jgi:hypothetical protein